MCELGDAPTRNTHYDRSVSDAEASILAQRLRYFARFGCRLCVDLLRVSNSSGPECEVSTVGHGNGTMHPEVAELLQV
jgi:hypothetical protein